MKFGANTFIWTSPFTMKDLGLFSKIKEMGFDLVEIAVLDISLLDLKIIKKKLRELDLACSVMSVTGPDADISAEDETSQKSGKEYIKECVKVAAELGTDTMTGPVYSGFSNLRFLSDEERKKQWERSVRNLREISQFAQRHGVIIGLEPIQRFETDLVNTTDSAIRMVEDVNSPSIRIQLDTFHMNIEDKNMEESIRKTGKYLWHLHACENDRGIPGTGHIPWKGVARALRQIGYDRCVAIESFAPKVEAIAKPAGIWRSLAPDQDTLAREGLKFLKGIFK